MNIFEKIISGWNKSKKIIWLALESLRRQKDIDFGWELIIYEDGDDSSDIIKEFEMAKKEVTSF